MKVNEHTAVSTSRVLLVPYDARHVPTYHAWMEDEAIRTATASDRLTLEEEYANQVSWRADADKLTFIVCRPLDTPAAQVRADVDDAPARMVGDINFFLTPWEEEEEEEGTAKPDTETGPVYCGEVDVMIAQTDDRGKGFGRAAVTAFLHYILRAKNLPAILEEATAGSNPGPTAKAVSAPVLRQLVVKIQATNAASIGLFSSLGFAQKGDVNYFGEVELVCADPGTLASPAPGGYTECLYVRES